MIRTIRSNYKGDIKATINTTARAGSKAFSDIVKAYEIANGFPVNTFNYYDTYGARGVIYPKVLKRF